MIILHGPFNALPPNSFSSLFALASRSKQGLILVMTIGVSAYNNSA